jgi:hypothetical protein
MGAWKHHIKKLNFCTRNGYGEQLKRTNIYHFDLEYKKKS